MASSLHKHIQINLALQIKPLILFVTGYKPSLQRVVCLFGNVQDTY